jgi:hypothetical protein
MYKRIEEIGGEPLPNKFKTNYLLRHIKGAQWLTRVPKVWREDLVCVIINKSFDEARYVSNQLELDLLLYITDRKLNWLFIPDAKSYIE